MQTEDQKRVAKRLIGNLDEWGTFPPEDKDELVKDIKAVNRVLGTNLIVRELRSNEVRPSDIDKPRWLIVREVVQIDEYEKLHLT